METKAIVTLCVLAAIELAFASPLSNSTEGYFAKRTKREASVQTDDYMAKRVKRSTSCAEKYQSLTDSTMCKYSKNDAATNTGVSYDDIVKIVDTHNDYRSTEVPIPANMQKLYWDQEMAIIAQHYAETCPGITHDGNHERWVPGYGISIGQNLCRGHSSWEACINDWHKESDDYTYGQSTDAMVGHYVQMVIAEASSVGCGYAECPNGKNYVCNYAYGQTNTARLQPYRTGSERCSECQSSCDNGLCDCLGWICMNGGTLDQNTCTCNCLPNYSGSACHIIDCPPRDSSMCAVWEQADCLAFTKVYNDCPVLCGRCEERCPSWSASDCKNGGVLNWDTCSCVCSSDWKGPKCEEPSAACKADAAYCAGYAAYCFDSYVASTCPNVCGIC